MKLYCDVCGDEIPFIKPINACNVYDGWDNEFITYVLCRKCFDKLNGFLNGKATDVGDM